MESNVPECEMRQTFSTSTPVKQSRIFSTQSIYQNSSPSGYTPKTKSSKTVESPRLTDVKVALKQHLKYQKGATLSRYAVLRCLNESGVSRINNYTLGRVIQACFPLASRKGKMKDQYQNIAFIHEGDNQPERFIQRELFGTAGACSPSPTLASLGPALPSAVESTAPSTTSKQTGTYDMIVKPFSLEIWSCLLMR